MFVATIWVVTLPAVFTGAIDVLVPLKEKLDREQDIPPLETRGSKDSPPLIAAAVSR